MGEGWVRILVLAVVLAVATVGGLVWQSRNGRVRTSKQPSHPVEPTIASEASTPPEEPDLPELGPVWASIGVEPAQAAVTLVQFSSAFCAPCRATRRILTDVVTQLPDVRHVEVDAESHLDVVRALEVRSTPTTLLVDRSGRVAARAVGAPRKTDVLAALGPFLAGSE
jgi:thiol-disulfide isomerase/thioredoxin